MNFEAAMGDVFVIPISDSLMGIGQVIDVLQHELYLVVFEETRDASDSPRADEVCGCKPLFSTLSLDAKLWNGDWKIIGNCRRNVATIAKPLFKVLISDIMYVESYRGSQRRPAREDEIEKLRNRTTVAPIRLEKALRAWLGLAEWNPMYEELFYTYATMSSALAEDSCSQ